MLAQRYYFCSLPVSASRKVKDINKTKRYWGRTGAGARRSLQEESICCGAVATAHLFHCWNLFSSHRRFLNVGGVKVKNPAGVNLVLAEGSSTKVDLQ